MEIVVLSMSFLTWVAEVTETTSEGTLEHDWFNK